MGEDLNTLSHNKKCLSFKGVYTYKIEDYGNGLLCFVIVKDEEEVFHSNGYNKIEDAEEEAKRYIIDKEMFNLITQEDILERQIKESIKENHEQTSEDLSNILARQKQKERGFKLNGI